MVCGSACSMGFSASCSFPTRSSVFCFVSLAGDLVSGSFRWWPLSLKEFFACFAVRGVRPNRGKTSPIQKPRAASFQRKSPPCRRNTGFLTGSRPVVPRGLPFACVCREQKEAKGCLSTNRSRGDNHFGLLVLTHAVLIPSDDACFSSLFKNKQQGIL